MGCVSSKLFRKEDILCKDYTSHVVSLTSSTYGVLKLDKDNNNNIHMEKTPLPIIKERVREIKKSPPRQVNHHEVINTWELMEGLDEEVVVPTNKISPKSRVFLRGFADIDARSPLKFLNQMTSPRKFKKFGGKENKGVVGKSDFSPKTVLNERKGVVGKSDFSPKAVLKESKLLGSPWKVSPRVKCSKEGTPNQLKSGSLTVDSLVVSSRRRSLSPNQLKSGSLTVDSLVVSSRRRSLSPLFDPQLVAEFEKELSEEGEQIKKTVSVTPISRKARNSLEAVSMLELFEKKCPPGGENAVVIYTTTLRGIRKTFEDCNTARAILESSNIQIFERDISMHSGYKEELRGLMGKKEMKVPLVFVKGRLIGGADEMVKLEEEGKLGILLDGIPRAVAACHGCAGIRFMMCMDCNGSRKVLAKDGKSTVKCGVCNENGLIQCPFCC